MLVIRYYKLQSTYDFWHKTQQRCVNLTGPKCLSSKATTSSDVTGVVARLASKPIVQIFLGASNASTSLPRTFERRSMDQWIQIGRDTGRNRKKTNSGGSVGFITPIPQVYISWYIYSLVMFSISGVLVWDFLILRTPPWPWGPKNPPSVVSCRVGDELRSPEVPWSWTIGGCGCWVKVQKQQLVWSQKFPFLLIDDIRWY